MSNIFWKNFYLCFSKFQCLSTTLPPPPPPPPQPPSLSSQQHHSLPSPTSTLIKNFNSLYDPTSDNSTTTTSKSLTSSSSSSFFSSSDDSDTDSPPPDLATIFASQRFFFSSPGTSNSIIESPDTPRESVTVVVAGGVAVQTDSPDPYSDFRRSMQEMVEARRLMDVEADWDYLHELLLCYLTLNPKHTHKFIVGAFSDLLISIMSSTTTTTTDSHRRKLESCQRSAVSQRLL